MAELNDNRIIVETVRQVLKLVDRLGTALEARRELRQERPELSASFSGATLDTKSRKSSSPTSAASFVAFWNILG